MKYEGKKKRKRKSGEAPEFIFLATPCALAVSAAIVFIFRI